MTCSEKWVIIWLAFPQTQFSLEGNNHAVSETDVEKVLTLFPEKIKIVVSPPCLPSFRNETKFIVLRWKTANFKETVLYLYLYQLKLMWKWEKRFFSSAFRVTLSSEFYHMNRKNSIIWNAVLFFFTLHVTLQLKCRSKITPLQQSEFWL